MDRGKRKPSRVAVDGAGKERIATAGDMAAAIARTLDAAVTDADTVAIVSPISRDIDGVYYLMFAVGDGVDRFDLRRLNVNDEAAAEDMRAMLCCGLDCDPRVTLISAAVGGAFSTWIGLAWAGNPKIAKAAEIAASIIHGPAGHA